VDLAQWNDLNKNGRVAWPNDGYNDKPFVGWVVALLKILFEDGTTGEASKSASCYGEYWRDKKHQRLNKTP
jgi:hypothetical protein